IDTGPLASTVNVDAEFTFSSNDPLAEFECSLDDQPFSSCSTPHQVAGLLAGNHELRVRAINDAGTFDITAASYTWIVKPLPDTAIINRPADPSDSDTATFTFVSNLADATFECALDEAADSGTFTPCASGITYTGLLFGEHAFAVRAVDADGNVDAIPAEWECSVEGAVPPVLITSGPDVTTESRTAEFVFEANGHNLRYECSFDGGEFSLCLSPKTYNGVPLGPHDFAVRVYASEEIGTDAPVTTWDWTVVDNVAPETTIVFGPPDPDSTVDPETGESIATFAFESNDPLATFECALDGAVLFTDCPSDGVFSGLAEGAHILRVRAVDVALLADASPAEWRWTVVRDSTPPVTTITNASVIAVEGVFEAIISFTANEQVYEFQCQLDSQAFEQCDSPMEYSDLTPGTHTFRVRAIDLARNVEHPPVSTTLQVGTDTVAPETTILSGPPANSIDDWATFELQASEEVIYFECAIEFETTGEPLWEECFSPAQYVELEPGDYTFMVRAVDLALNVDPTPATWTWTYEPPTPAPETTIHTAPINPSTNINPVFQFSAVGPVEEYECALDAEPFESCETPYLIEEIEPGLHVFQV
ncbi:MAG TPA: hypothetical protein VGZ51_04800, partial [Actinomycetota bacterium]|nr:hypothetical protein [Actinomycetota bacterium]